MIKDYHGGIFEETLQKNREATSEINVEESSRWFFIWVLDVISGGTVVIQLRTFGQTSDGIFGGTEVSEKLFKKFMEKNCFVPEFSY